MLFPEQLAHGELVQICIGTICETKKDKHRECSGTSLRSENAAEHQSPQSPQTKQKQVELIAPF